MILWALGLGFDRLNLTFGKLDLNSLLISVGINSIQRLLQALLT